MKLMTKEIERRLKKAPLYSKDGRGTQAEVVVKYFTPYGANTWLITEGNQLDNGDWELFGYIFIYCWEWGYVLLSELQSIPMMERDLYAKGTVKELM